MKITEALIAEHVVFCSAFEQVERLLPELRELNEARALAMLLEGMLGAHGQSEDDLVFPALSHSLEHKGLRARLLGEHLELHDCLRQIRSAPDLHEARRLFQAAMLAARRHFDDEEAFVFPLMEEVLEGQTLSVLGRAWDQRRATLMASPPNPAGAPPADRA